MKKILEFQLKDNYEIEMPENAEILTVQVKDTQAYIYVIADPSAPTELRKFMMITAEDEVIPENTASKMYYIGSFQVKLSNWGELWVYHVFELV